MFLLYKKKKAFSIVKNRMSFNGSVYIVRIHS